MRKLSLVLGILALASFGCSNETAESAPPAPSTADAKVAQVWLDGSQSLEIYSVGRGFFAYKQSGAYGSNPISLPQELMDTGNPVEIFRTLAPAMPVPDRLTAAVDRARADMENLDPNGSSEPDPAMVEQITHSDAGKHADVTGSVGQAQTGSTGSPGCPQQFLDLASLNGIAFCPAADGNTVCWHFVGWSYIWNPDGKSGYATVCSDWNTTHLNLHMGDSEVPSQSFDTPVGTWTRVQIRSLGDCGWWSCSHWHGYFKWQVPGVNGEVYNMGAHIDPN